MRSHTHAKRGVRARVRVGVSLMAGLAVVGGGYAFAQAETADGARAGSTAQTQTQPQAQAAPRTLAEDKTTYGLNIDTDRDYKDLGKYVTDLENKKAVKPVSALSVAQSAQHTGRPALCHNTGLNNKLKYDGFCWDIKDDNTSDWQPQGLTGSHDAQPSGTVGGHHLYAASWHSRTNEFQRVSLAESNGGKVTYGHVLLVRPNGRASGFSAAPGHGDGAVWYGNKLLVAAGSELQVYDMRHLWKMDTTGEARVGVSGGKASARHHGWALPMVARYTTGPRDAEPGKCKPGGGLPVCLSSLSLDRSSGTDALVSGEYVKHNRGGRVVRWPLNESTAMPKSAGTGSVGKAESSAAYTTPVFSMQGVATDGDTYFMTGDCPGVDPSKPDQNSCVHYAKPEKAPHVLTKAPIYTQNLSWAPQSRRLWGLNEYTSGGAGKRVIFSLQPNP